MGNRILTKDEVLQDLIATADKIGAEHGLSPAECLRLAIYGAAVLGALPYKGEPQESDEALARPEE